MAPTLHPWPALGHHLCHSAAGTQHACSLAAATTSCASRRSTAALHDLHVRVVYVVYGGECVAWWWVSSEGQSAAGVSCSHACRPPHACPGPRPPAPHDPPQPPAHALTFTALAAAAEEASRPVVVLLWSHPFTRSPAPPKINQPTFTCAVSHRVVVAAAFTQHRPLNCGGVMVAVVVRWRWWCCACAVTHIGLLPAVGVCVLVSDI